MARTHRSALAQHARAMGCNGVKLCLALVLLCLAGCQLHRGQGGQGGLGKLLHPHRAVGYIENPLFIPECDREFVWQQLVDAIDTHFKIEREERMRVVGDVITPGEITTFPVSAATLLEPWRGNSVGFTSRLTSTLQTQRKHAKVLLIPTTGGYQAQVQVFVQQEDLDRPERSTVGGSSLRHDGTIARIDPRRDDADAEPAHLGWIDVGRDTALEQKLLADIRDRMRVAFAAAPTPSPVP